MNAQRAIVRVLLMTGSLAGGMLAGVHLAKGSDQTKLTSRRTGSIAIERQAGASSMADRYYAFDTPFVISDPRSSISIQLKVALSSTSISTLQEVKELDPAIRSSIIIALTELGPEILSGDLTKSMLRLKIEEAINTTLSLRYMNSKIEEIYLTDFVVIGLDA